MPIQVFGHPRSGNHVLASALQRALFPDLEPLRIANTGTGHWTKRKRSARYCIEGEEQTEAQIEMPYGHLMGTHVFPRGDVSKVVYVMRDGRDVALSFWNWKKFRPPDQEDLPLEIYLRTPLDWRGSPGHKFPAKKRYVLFDHWRDHVSAWLKSEALCVRYERLVTDPEAVVRRVADHFKLEVFDPGSLPDAVGWNPSGGKPRVGVWRDELPDDSKELFDKKVPAEHLGRWEPT